MKSLIFVVATLFLNIGCGYGTTESSSTISANEAVKSPAQKVAGIVKASLEGWTSEDFYSKMKNHYQTLRLVDESGAWKSPEFAAHSTYLLPRDIKLSEVYGFVDRIAELAEQNPYLVSFLEKAEGQEFPVLAKKIAEEGTEVLGEVAAFALIMERLNTVMIDNWQLMEVAGEIWKKERKAANMKEHMNLFEVAKLYSVEYLIYENIKYNKNNSVSPDFMKIMLPVNILEAMFEDVRLGFYDNARAGWPLTVNNPGKQCETELQCEAHWDSEKKMILVTMPDPKAWADMYQTWNMGFVAHYNNFPYLLVKLLIPQVSDYNQAPESYIYRRGVSLYTFIHWLWLDRADRRSQSLPEMDWIDRDFIKLWGATNLESSKEYEKRAEEYNSN